VTQGAASVLLVNLEKEKELLHIFLRVLQMEDAVPRRMNLNPFILEKPRDSGDVSWRLSGAKSRVIG
jgi:hypothetical protein